MIKQKNSRVKSSLTNFIQKQTSEVLEPIYSKVNLLKRQLQSLNSQRQADRWYQQSTSKNCIDKNVSLQKERKFHQTHNKILSNDKSIKKDEQFSAIKTATSWKDHTRNKTKSLINFLTHTKDIRLRVNIGTKHGKRNGDQNYPQSKNDQFEPVGEQYKKQKLYQESIKSQSQSISSSRLDSISLHSSSALGLRKDNSRKYLRKGTRVREILMRQLQTPEQRGSSASSLTYLKDYDQWVPSTLVEQKKAELQNFMNIMYGDKKNKKVQAVNLNKIQLIYL